MLKLSFLSKSIKKLAINYLFRKDFYNIIKNKPLINIGKGFYTEKNKNTEFLENSKVLNLEKKLFENSNKDLDDKIKNEEIISNFNLNFDSKINNIFINKEILKDIENTEGIYNKENIESIYNKENTENDDKTSNKIKENNEEIESIRKLLNEFYSSKMKIREYRGIAKDCREKMNSEFLVNFFSDRYNK